MSITVSERKLQIDTIRALSMDCVQRAGAGHPGTAMALAPLGHTLYTRFLRVNPADPAWADRDRFVLSAGHACVLQYALAHLCGFDLTLEDLRSFRQWDSRTPGHPERGRTPGVEITTGPLGQGLANAVGMAMAERFLSDRFNRPEWELVDHRTWVVCSDGDMMEGISHEAASIAGHLRLGKLIACYDDNRITIDGSTTISDDAAIHTARMRAYGWHVQRVEDAEDVQEIEAALSRAREERERPSFISIRSHIAYPAPHARDTAAAHGAPLGEQEVRATKEAMGLDPERTFEVPEPVYRQMDLRPAGERAQLDWEAKLLRWREQFPEMAGDWDLAWRGRMREGWRNALPRFGAEEKLATREAARSAMASFARFAPTMIGGAADLVESTRTSFEGAGLFSAVHAGRNVAFGIREHAMGAIVNGAGAHGGIVKPYGSTFLIFSDYMRPSVRLSALMGLPVVWVWTHDSVGVGEDGPTHQPVEQCASLRAIPGLWVIRPADANETSLAWRAALERTDGPVAILLSRQKVPVIARGDGVAGADGLLRGGYVLWDSPGSGGHAPQIILIATGAEVGPTLTAARQLASEGARARVVSMPCLDLFEGQDEDYRETVLPAAAPVRLAVEPGAGVSWWRWVAPDGDVLAIDRFGASAPGTRVLQELGFTAEGIAERARALLERSAGDEAGRGGKRNGSIPATTEGAAT